MRNKKYSFILGFIFLVTTISAQDPYLQDLDENTESESVDITKMYLEELPMNGQQAAIFQNKVAEFLLRKKKIEALDVSISQQLRLLRKLSKQETAEMATLLERRQLRYYRKLKKEIQPIMIVVGEVE